MPRLTYRIFGGTALYPKIKALGHYPDYLWWVLRGKPVRSPHLLKQMTVVAYGRKHQLLTLVETGTYHGEMVNAVLGHFDRIYSIQLNPEWADFARRRFAQHPEVHIVQGSSQEKVAEVLAEMNEPLCSGWTRHITASADLSPATLSACSQSCNPYCRIRCAAT